MTHKRQSACVVFVRQLNIHILFLTANIFCFVFTLKLHSPMVFEFLSFLRDKYIKLTIIVYLTIVLRSIYFKWLTFEIFEVRSYEINFGNHAKTLTPSASDVTGSI